jgi:SOS regulatory protein LexA
MGAAVVRRMEDDPAQQEIFALLVEAVMGGEWTPTTRELAKRARPPRVESNVHQALAKLEENGHIERDKDANGKAIPGAIRLRGMPKTRLVPLLGRVAAGKLVPSSGDDVMGYMPLPADRVRSEGVYLLKVVGHSMTGDGIHDGDFVVVVADPEPGDDKIVVVNVDGESTVKRLRREPEGIRLLGSNPDVGPIFIKYSEEPLVQGRVIGVIRWLQ